MEDGGDGRDCTTASVATVSVATVTVFLDMEDGGDGRVTVRLPVLQHGVSGYGGWKQERCN